MIEEPKVTGSEEANEFIESIDDPITKHLLTNTMFHFLRRYYEQKDRPASDFDLLYFVKLMREIFGEHEVLKRILEGEKVGAFFSDDEEL